MTVRELKRSDGTTPTVAMRYTSTSPAGSHWTLHCNVCRITYPVFPPVEPCGHIRAVCDHLRDRNCKHGGLHVYFEVTE